MPVFAVGADEVGDFWRNHFGLGSLTEEVPKKLAILFGGSGGQSVVTHSHEAFGQDVETPTSQKFMRMKFKN